MLKPRDYWFTVLLVDPLATPAARWAAKGATPNVVTSLSLWMAVLAAWCFSSGRLVQGGVAYYLHFFLDCMDGKMARLQGTGTSKGKFYDRGVDLFARSALSIALIAYHYRIGAYDVAIAFGVLGWMWLFTWGMRNNKFLIFVPVAYQPEYESVFVSERWDRWTLRFRLSRTPGFADLFALVFIVGPISGHVLLMAWIGIICTFICGIAIAIDAATRQPTTDILG